MNDLNVLTEKELDAVSGGDKSTVPVTKVEVGLGHGSAIQAAIDEAAALIGTGHF